MGWVWILFLSNEDWESLFKIFCAPSPFEDCIWDMAGEPTLSLSFREFLDREFDPLIELILVLVWTCRLRLTEDAKLLALVASIVLFFKEFKKSISVASFFFGGSTVSPSPEEKDSSVSVCSLTFWMSISFTGCVLFKGEDASLSIVCEFCLILSWFFFLED